MDLVPVDHDPFANAPPPAVPNGVTLQPVDHDPWAPYVNPETGRPEISVSKAPAEGVVAKSGRSIAQPSVAEQVAGFPQRAADMTIGALGPIGEAGMTVGDMLRTGHVDPRDIPQVVGGVMMGVAAPEAEEAAPLEAGAEAVAKGITAYHGSPYDFDKFDLSKIGTGEGAQAYGHGLYFAENPETAQSYKGNLTNRADQEFDVPGYGPIDRTSLARIIANSVGAKTPYGATSVLRDLAAGRSLDEIRASNPQSFGPSIDAMDKLKVSYRPPQPGKTYQVSINADPEHFLDWDKPLSEQSEHVKSVIANVDKSISPTAPSITQIKDPQIRNIVRSALKQNDGQADGLELMIDNDSGLYNAAVAHAKRNGVDLEQNDMRASDYIYQQAKPYIDALHASQNLMGDSLAKVLGIKGADMMQAGPAAARLRQAGIPGIKYLDQGSRGSGTGTKNYVVFDDNLINIVKKYGLAGLIAGGASHFATQPVDHDPFAARSQ